MIDCLGGKLAGIKECIGELFTFTEGRFNDLEAVYIGKKIAHRLVGIGAEGVSILGGVAIQTIRDRHRIHCEERLLRSICCVCGMEGGK